MAENSKWACLPVASPSLCQWAMYAVKGKRKRKISAQKD
jgi:hypothetical protein